MLTLTANEDSRLSFWLRVREFAVPASMIETATARRHAGDWAGACAAAGIDVDLDLRAVVRVYGRDFASRLRADLRHLAPDLLRWHLPRVAPDGLLRAGLTIALARYEAGVAGRDDTRWPVHLVVRTPPAWADAGQRFSLTLWDGSNGSHGPHRTLGSHRSLGAPASHGFHGSLGPHGGHPHPRPSRRFRFDLHRHLWDARRADELRIRAGTGAGPGTGAERLPRVDGPSLPDGHGCAVDRWADEAEILLRAEGRTGGTGAVLVRLGRRHRLLLELSAGVAGPESPVPRTAPPAAYADGGADLPMSPDGMTWVAPEPPVPSVSRTVVTTAYGGGDSGLPVLPDAATWVPPDLELLRAGAIEAGRLHPLVASALVPDHPPSSLPSPTGHARLSSPVPSAASGRPGKPHLVECRGEPHRIGLVDGVLAPLDHGPDEVRREELLVALTGTPLPCLQAIDDAHRRPDCLTGVRERLVHGDIDGALAVVEGLLGPGAILRDGALRDELEAAARRRITYGLFRAGLSGPGRDRIAPGPSRPTDHRSHPRDTTAR